ncbi:MAG: acyl-CoA dehydrogenase family protein [Acidobacteriota bacterium]
MAIDFTLTTEQKALRLAAREFAQEVLKPLVAKADEEPDPQLAFQTVKPAYEQAYKLGFAMGPIPKKYGGGGVSNVDLQLVAEEICAVDPGFACILLVNGLALMPVVWFASEEQKVKWLGAATSDPNHDFIAGWCVSEPAGTPGGTAAFDHPDPHPVGHGTTAIHDKANGEYVINGRKYWPSSAAGWDFKGANLNTVTVRTDPTKGGRAGLSCVMVERGTPGMRFEPNINKLGHRLNQNVNMVFEDCRVPEENVFALGDGDLVISKAFTWSGPVAGIAATAVGRSAYEYTLNWAKTYTGGGDKPIINYQAVGYMLADAAMRIEACRYLSWKAAHYLDMYDSEGQAFGAMSKVFCSETMFETVYKCMQVMGINSLDKAHPMEKYLREAAVLPIYDAGNIGMQRRKIWGVLADPDFDPRAFMDSKPVKFSKAMEGMGVKAVDREPAPV